MAKIIPQNTTPTHPFKEIIIIIIISHSKMEENKEGTGVR